MLEGIGQIIIHNAMQFESECIFPNSHMVQLPLKMPLPKGNWDISRNLQVLDDCIRVLVCLGFAAEISC